MTDTVIVRMCSTHCYPFGDAFKMLQGNPVICGQCQLRNLKMFEKTSYDKTMVFLSIESEIQKVNGQIFAKLDEHDELNKWIEQLRRND